jgi:iron-sulfur cluster insertion protein
MEQVNITKNAVKKIFDMLNEEQNLNLKLRVFVQGGGCSGFQYGFTFDEDVNDDDFQIVKKEQGQDICFLIDPLSMQYLVGATVDYKEDLNGSQFIISNPNATSTCGCGSSFAS